MARVTYKLSPTLHATLDVDNGSWSGTARKAVYTDRGSGDKLIVEGNGLDYQNGNLADGTLSKLSLVDAEGEKFETLTGFKLDAEAFSGNNFMARFEKAMGKILDNDLNVIGTKFEDEIIGRKGNDIIFGGADNDELGGGAGADKLTGGDGVDTFVFREGYEKETITDFDTDGSDGFQDFIQAAFSELESITGSDEKTILNFGDGDTIVLLGVHPSTIDVTDFV